MNLSDIDCPQFISFTSSSFQNSHCEVEDEHKTPSPMQCKQSQNSPLLNNAETDKSIGDENVDDSFDADSFLGAVAQNHTTMKHSTLRSPLTELDSLENSMEEFPVNKNVHFVTSNNINQYKPRNVTKVKEFHLTEAIQKETKNYVSLAEQVAAFQKKTPARFHTVGPKQYEPVEQWVPPIINPKSPELQTAKRCRPNTAVSRKEQEEKEVQEMKNYKFHANPLKSKVFSNPCMPKKKKPVTEAKDIKLKTAKRAADRQYPKEENEKYEFHAMPVPKFIFAGPTGLKEKISLPATIPKSPDFALKERQQKWKTKNEQGTTLNKVKEFHAHPVPSNPPFVVKHEKQVTQFKPFTFDEKDKERYALRKRKIDEMLENQTKIPQFKAQAIPNMESRLSCSAIRRTRRKELDPAEASAVFVFKARPADVLKKLPFVPEKEPAEIPAFKEFQFHTEKRVEEWNKIKERNCLKEMERERMLLQMKAEEEEKEREEIKKLRKDLVHKANPVRTFKNVEIKRSKIPLTVPKSPSFETKKRVKSSTHSSKQEQNSKELNSTKISQE